jgi:hypothetical protein
MGGDFWYLDGERNQRGPVAQDEIVRLIGVGAIGRDTLIWTSGFNDWTPAGQIESFSACFGASAPPAPPTGGLPAGGWQKGPLIPSLPVWSLLGRGLLFAIGSILIIPAPWTATSYYKWLAERIALPDRTPLSFAGKPGDIWYVFVGIGALAWMGEIHYIGLLAFLLSCALGVMVMKWFCANLRSADGRLQLSFEGGYWTYIGWQLLLVLSFITIIGWAWVLKFMMQWVCKNVRGAPGFEFTATGLALLWRSLAFVLLCVFVIPIPWALRWYASWYVSQISVTDPSACLPARSQPAP